MAGAMREIVDPVEVAKEGIGSSRRLIATTLDDLSKHHSWLETYHRDERLRAERLRRQRLLERLALVRQRAVKKTRRGARAAYTAGRVLTRLSKRRALAFMLWATPRARTASRHAAETASGAWSWVRRRTPEFTQRATDAATLGFQWSVQASEEAGYVFRWHVSAAYAEGMAELVRRAAPMRRRAASGLTRMQLCARRGRALAQQQLAETIAGSQSIARLRQTLHRGTIQGRLISAHAAAQVRHQAILLEFDLSAWIIRIVPELRRHLQEYMPGTAVPARPATGPAGCDLILRPTTALACIAPIGNRLPVPYHA
jgi:hypothetical protein